ncbi:GAF domain-containing protein [Chryseosolibacter indicus]|uniref:GAF domain-containing protein n=1 Tax=Chryseosolibacter indicus TaxID=2782351 RepID=A0ABS5VNR9_9BACT|nr:GAF domain-containing protein [Chryseosolibacter indicus]MBT1703090.1 GAF domain-containing protein [Chryseosolibacter indicus]
MKQTSTLKEFPFKTVLNLNLLAEYWEKSIRSGEIPAFAHGVLESLSQAPELRKPIEDISVLEKHRDLVNFLMGAVIPSAQTEEDLIAATIPFDFKSFYATKAFQKTIDFGKLSKTSKVDVPANEMVIGKTIHACMLILKHFYNVDVNFDRPILGTIRDPETGLDKIYKIEIGRQFISIVAKQPLKPIDPKVIKFLTEKIYDVDLWLQYIRPEDFEFNGFMIVKMFDVTEQEMISSIKFDLLEKNAVTKEESFAKIQHKLQSMFNMPEIRLGLAFFDLNNNIVLNSSGNSNNCWRTLARDRETGSVCGSFDGSIYEQSWEEKKYIIIEDLQSFPYKGSVEEALIKNGVRNILLAPLVDDGETIGMLEIASTFPGKLNSLNASKVENALPMFTAAAKRVKEELLTEVRALIQEECTNIHPAVQWRFFEAGSNLLNKRRRGEKAVLEEIVFKDVFPLYGLADVRNSSIERNLAIQQDLQQNLQMVKELLQKINQVRQLPILEEVTYKTDHHLTKLNQGLAAGDESTVLDFLKEEINPLLKHFEKEHDLNKLVNKYLGQLDSQFGVVYKRRKAFEESLSMINKMISSFLDEAEGAAQEMYPHYFEKYQTDGIEYTLYLGESLTRGHKFDQFYLKNFRLWQLMLMCEIDKRMDQLKPTLKNNLDITQLILVHDQPLSIRFRPDEKQFDVDGAYDIRYEIVKKRIDKAYIKDSGERLTQPGKIAIVYNHAKVEEEYIRYFDYLKTKGIITGKIEHLELEELPGANGLKALRIEVVKQKKSIVSHKEDIIRNIEEALSLQ